MGTTVPGGRYLTPDGVPVDAEGRPVTGAPDARPVPSPEAEADPAAGPEPQAEDAPAGARKRRGGGPGVKLND